MPCPLPSCFSERHTYWSGHQELCQAPCHHQPLMAQSDNLGTFIHQRKPDYVNPKYVPWDLHPPEKTRLCQPKVCPWGSSSTGENQTMSTQSMSLGIFIHWRKPDYVNPKYVPWDLHPPEKTRLCQPKVCPFDIKIILS